MEKTYTMTPDLFWRLFGLAMIGMLFETVVKLIVLKNKAKKANVSFSLGSYLKDDYLSFIASILAIFIILFIFDTLANWKPILWEFVKPFFIVIGAYGSNLLYRAMSKTNKNIEQVIDIKTDIADGKNNPNDNIINPSIDPK